MLLTEFYCLESGEMTIQLGGTLLLSITVAGCGRKTSDVSSSHLDSATQIHSDAEGSPDTPVPDTGEENDKTEITSKGEVEKGSTKELFEFLAAQQVEGLGLLESFVTRVSQSRKWLAI